MKNNIQNDGIKRAVIYCRVSTKEQVDEGNSLVLQERICRDYAAKEGYEVVEVFIEKGKSAKTVDRKELKRLRALCIAKKANIHAVIAYKVDRISRNIADYTQIRVLLKKHGVEIKSVTEYFEDTPAGRFMENIIANVGQFDNDVRTERIVDGMREATTEGRYVWTAPKGYSNVKVNDKSTIAKNEFAPLMKEVFELIAQRIYSSDAIRIMMAEKGLVNKAGRPLTRSTFFLLIRNVLYKGKIKKFGQIYPGTFDPIVSEELFDDVQAILKGRKNRVKHYLNENPDFPLRRFVLNEEGKQLTGYWSKGKRLKYPYYSFHQRGTTIRKEKLEKKFMDFLATYLFDTKHLNALRVNLEKHFGKQIENRKNDKEIIQNRIIALNEQIDNLINLQLAGSISSNILSDRVNKCETEIEELSGLLKIKSDNEVNISELMQFAVGALKEPHLLWQKSSLDIRRKKQVFDFPNGVIFDGSNFRTPKVCSIYKLKLQIDAKKFVRVHSGDTGKNTYNTHVLLHSDINLLETKEFWQSIVDDLRALKDIYTNSEAIEYNL